MKYYARLIRIEVKSSIVEVEASSPEEASVLAADAALNLAPDDWVDMAREGEYAPVVDAAIPEDEFDGMLPSAVWPRTAFALLRADLESMQGQLLAQPWMFSLDGLAQADLADDWVEEVHELREKGVAAWTTSTGGDPLQRLGALVLRRQRPA